MKFLVDDQLPVTLEVHLRALGQDCLHVLEAELARAPDQPIWARAIATGAIIITKDRDFVMRHRNRPPHARVLWLRCGNIGNRALTRRIEAALPGILRQFRDGARLVEAL